MGAKDRHGEGEVRRCREQTQDMRQTWIVRRREHRKSGGVVDGERWRWTCQTICPLLLSSSLRPFPWPAYSSPAWKPSHWPSWGEEREVLYGRPPATINSCTSGTYGGFGPRIPRSVALGSCLLPDVKIWGLWVVLFISNIISLKNKILLSTFKNNLFPPSLLHYKRKQCKLIIYCWETMKRYTKI